MVPLTNSYHPIRFFTTKLKLVTVFPILSVHWMKSVDGFDTTIR